MPSTKQTKNSASGQTHQAKEATAVPVAASTGGAQPASAASVIASDARTTADVAHAAQSDFLSAVNRGGISRADVLKLFTMK